MRHKDSIDRYLDHDLLLEQRLIYIGSSIYENGEESGVDANMAERLVKSLQILQMGPKAEEPITIQMNSLGGSWHHGAAMYDAIRACKAHVRIECMGYCMSMATVILQSGDDRVLHPNVRFMIHDGSDGFAGRARDFERWGDESKYLRKEMYRIFAERSGQPVGYWAKKCSDDTIMSAEQAVREGLADQVIPHVKQFGRKRPARRKA